LLFRLAVRRSPDDEATRADRPTDGAFPRDRREDRRCPPDLIHPDDPRRLSPQPAIHQSANNDNNDKVSASAGLSAETVCCDVGGPVYQGADGDGRRRSLSRGTLVDKQRRRTGASLITSVQPAAATTGTTQSRRLKSARVTAISSAHRPSIVSTTNLVKAGTRRNGG